MMRMKYDYEQGRTAFRVLYAALGLGNADRAYHRLISGEDIYVFPDVYLWAREGNLMIVDVHDRIAQRLVDSMNRAAMAVAAQQGGVSA